MLAISLANSLNFFVSPGMYFKVVVGMSRAIDGDFIPRNAGDSSSFLDVIGHPGLNISSSFPMPTPTLLHSLVMIAGNHTFRWLEHLPRRS